MVAVEVEQTPGKRSLREDVMVGDILRGTSAVTMQQTYPTMNLMLGGTCVPSFSRANSVLLMCFTLFGRDSYVSFRASLLP